MKNILLNILAIIIFVSSAIAQGEFYDVIPDIASCQEGKLKDVEKQKILTKVNAIRQIHGLKPVTYDFSKDINVQESALLSAANEMLSHQPPTNWKCYTNEGSIGAQKSNLHIKWFYGNTYPKSEESINSWMIDMNVDVCGHRRWIIDPFLKFIAFGRVDGPSANNPQFKVSGASIYVIDNNKQQITDWDNDFIAYPYHNYPTELVFDGTNKYWNFHFTAVFNKNDWWSNKDVSYAAAVLEIKDENNNTVAFTDVTSNNEGYGVPNMLRFKITNLQKDKRYSVSVKNVDFLGTKKDFSYWFKVTDNVGELPDAPSLLVPSNGATEQTTDLTLSWSQLSNAASYNLEIARDMAFNQLFLSESNISAASYQVNGMSQSTQYYWRVSATNDIGTGSWSSGYSFTTGKSSGGSKPILVYPEDNQSSIPPNAEFSWQAIQDADSYHLQISDTENFPQSGLPIDQQNIPTNSYKVPNKILKENTKYWYRVRASEGDVFGEWSDVFSFMTWIASSVFESMENDESFSIHPNPASSEFIVNTVLQNIRSLTIYDQSGRLIESRTEISDGQSINISGLEAGSYIIVIVSDDNYLARKLQIVK